MSELIKDWIADYVDHHRRLFNPHDWPEVGSDDESDFVKMWRVAFLDMKPRPTRSEADTASVRLGSKPPRFRNDHLPAVLAEIAAIRASRPAADGPIAESRKLAEQQSIGCPHCAGAGWATVYHPRYDGNAVLSVEVMLPGGEVATRSAAARVSAFCTCALGRFFRAKAERDVAERIPDFGDALEGRVRWLPKDPVAEREELRMNPRRAVQQLAGRMHAPGPRTPTPDATAEPVPY